MRCRYLVIDSKSIYYNMALDEALLINADRNPLSIRLYRWKTPVYTIGYFQKVDELKKSGMIKEGIPYIRRITGGGLVKHGDDITYTISCCRAEKCLGKTSREIYRAVNTVFAGVFKKMNVAAVLAGVNGSFLGRSRNCFEERSAFDLISASGKIGGSAQRRKGDKFIQQGSLLEGSIDGDLFVEECLKEFCRYFGWDIREACLSRKETELAGYLCRTKYSTPEWNNVR